MFQLPNALLTNDCPNCGCAVSSTKSRCDYCGSFLVTEQNYVPQKIEIPQPKPKPQNKVEAREKEIEEETRGLNMSGICMSGEYLPMFCSGISYMTGIASAPHRKQNFNNDSSRISRLAS